MRKNRKNLLIIKPGDELKVFVFEELKKINVNIYVLVAEKTPEFLKKLISRKYTILTKNYDTQNMIFAIKIASKNKKIQFDGIVTFCEDVVIKTALVAEYFNLPCPSSQAVMQSSCNKYLMREVCRRKNIPMPKYKLFSSNSDGLKKYLSFKKPTVIKPINRASSEAVLKIDSPKDPILFRKKFNQMRKILYETQSSSEYYLIEEYVPGIVISVDGFIQNSWPHILSVSDFAMGKEPYFFQTNCFIPSNLNKKQINACHAITKKVIRAIGLNNCAFHCEVRMNNETPYLLEIAARCGGGFVALQIKDAYNVNFIEQIVKVSLGEKVSYKIRKSGIHTSNYRYTCDKKGIFIKISGLERIKKNLHIKKVAEITKPGEIITSKNMFAIAGFFISASSRKQVIKAFSFIEKELKYEVKKQNFSKFKFYLKSLFRKMLSVVILYSVFF